MKLYTEKEAARRLGITERQLGERRRNEKISCYYLDGVVRYSEQHINDYLQKCECQACPKKLKPRKQKKGTATGTLGSMTPTEAADVIQAASNAAKMTRPLTSTSTHSA